MGAEQSSLNSPSNLLPMKQETTISTPDRVNYAANPADPLIGDSESAKALIIDEGSRMCIASAGSGVRAVVLTGSMSRGEATLKRDGAGWRAMGDATFLVVSDRSIRLHPLELEQNIEASLLAKRIRCKIAVVISGSAQLREMKPHIYAYELRERGIVLWGRKDTLHLIPPFTAAQIPQEDGWWFLCNRIIEQLESAAESNGGCEDNQIVVRYRIAKLYLAMAACYLLAIGQYAPSYRDRAARLQFLAAFHNPQSLPIPLQRFSRFVLHCTTLKLEGEIGDNADYFPQWHDAVSDAEALWRWVLARITGASATLARRKLLAALAAQQSISMRAKGWARAVYVARPSRRCNWLRWGRLACSMSPRYLIYGAASELFFATAESATIKPTRLTEIVNMLPLTFAEQPSWSAAAMLVARNFHIFLESNRS
ncbi:MAG: hypothetical protein ACRD19_02525 [Terriglobia bacterium]